MPSNGNSNYTKVNPYWINIALLVILAVGGAVWTLQNSRQTTQAEHSQCISDIQQNVARLESRVDNVERDVSGFRELAGQVSSLVTDMKYLRKSVDELKAELRQKRQ